MRISIAVSLSVLWLPSAENFAFSPNFITRIIEEDTSSVPNTDSQRQWPPGVPVKTRFPPEPNGYLHLGHAKAVSFNFEVARTFGGTCNLRLDDTNPSGEDQEFAQSILQDVRWIQSGLFGDSESPWDGEVRKTSSYFDTIYDCAEYLIKQGDAYVDSLSPTQMQAYRGTLTEPGKDSPYRYRSVEENLKLFRKMRAGEFEDGEHVLRAKIDMASANMNMRDPTLYRIKHEAHKVMNKDWCIYPMYDFSHPISDALEGISHSLCTLEFEDHRPLYEWTLEKLLPSGVIHTKPRQIEFSRLNVQYTILSKRKLVKLVESGHVSGWDDPRMPTISGMRRRGYPPSALRRFCERAGISKVESSIHYSVLEDCVRTEMDDTCHRALCVLHPLKVTITNWDGGLEELVAPNHPKHESMGTRLLPFGRDLYIERGDFFDLEGPEGDATGGNLPKGYKRLHLGHKVRLRNAYVIQCDEVVRCPQTRQPTMLKCSYYPETRAGGRVEGSPREKGVIHWVEATQGVRCKVNQYSSLFLSEEPGKLSGDFLQDLNPNSLVVMPDAIVEQSVAGTVSKLLEELKTAAGARSAQQQSPVAYQFERNGYFSLDMESSRTDALVFNRAVTLRDTWHSRETTIQQDTAPRRRGRRRGDDTDGKNTGNGVGDVSRVAFCTATILEASPHPEADNLLVCKVDIGETEPRTVVAAIAGKMTVDDILGTKVVVVSNLKRARLRGVESSAMLLTVSNGKDSHEEKLEVLSVPSQVPNGELLQVEGLPESVPDPLMKSKGALKAFERVKAALSLNEKGEATWCGNGTVYRLLTSGGPVSAKSLKNAVIL